MSFLILFCFSSQVGLPPFLELPAAGIGVKINAHHIRPNPSSLKYLASLLSCPTNSCGTSLVTSSCVVSLQPASATANDIICIIRLIAPPTSPDPRDSATPRILTKLQRIHQAPRTITPHRPPVPLYLVTPAACATSDPCYRCQPKWSTVKRAHQPGSLPSMCLC